MMSSSRYARIETRKEKEEEKEEEEVVMVRGERERRREEDEEEESVRRGSKTQDSQFMAPAIHLTTYDDAFGRFCEIR